MLKEILLNNIKTGFYHTNLYYFYFQMTLTIVAFAPEYQTLSMDQIVSQPRTQRNRLLTIRIKAALIHFPRPHHVPLPTYPVWPNFQEQLHHFGGIPDCIQILAQEVIDSVSSIFVSYGPESIVNTYPITRILGFWGWKHWPGPLATFGFIFGYLPSVRVQQLLQYWTYSKFVFH